MTPKLYDALKWGALLGGPLAVFEAWSILVTLNSQNPADLDIAACLGTMLEALMPLIAGLLAARATGERRSGLIAGLTVGVIVALVNIISEMVLPISAFAASAGTAPPNAFDIIANWVTARAMTLGLGALFGWLGGRLGLLGPAGSP